MCKISLILVINTISLSRKYITYNCGVSLIIVIKYIN